MGKSLTEELDETCKKLEEAARDLAARATREQLIVIRKTFTDQGLPVPDIYAEKPDERLIYEREQLAKKAAEIDQKYGTPKML